ncbi:MAG: glycoside hydrolase family 5 protein [Pirellulaceae bacterium]
MGHHLVIKVLLAISFWTMIPWAQPATTWAQPAASLPRGHVFLQTDFESPDALQPWSGSAGQIVGDQNGHVLLVERPVGSPSGSATVQIALPVEPMRGYVVDFTARVKAENVQGKPNPWNGVKFMAPWTRANGDTNWPAEQFEEGSFAWRPVAFRVTVPRDAQQISLVLGLELVTGKVWFDDVRVTVRRPLPSKPKSVASGPIDKGHKLNRLRGAMVGPDIDEEDLRVFGQEWHANLIRWQLIRRGPIADPLDLQAYDRWLQGELAKVDRLLPACAKYGLLVALDLHSPPGGRSTSGGYAGSDSGLFTSAACQQRFVALWQDIARRYKDSPVIWGYDLANEPVESSGPDDLLDWRELAERAAKAIREVDSQRTIIVEPPMWGSPEGLLDFIPLDVPHVVYSVHMYIPHEFTHQNVNAATTPKVYPGEINGRMWDKKKLEEALQPALDFQQTYNVHIYIGEFSAIRWAPGNSAYRYLKDVIDILEAHDWDWSYHAFREWDGWSVEHGADRQNRQRSPTPTDREQLLRSWYQQNQKPEP